MNRQCTKDQVDERRGHSVWFVNGVYYRMHCQKENCTAGCPTREDQLVRNWFRNHLRMDYNETIPSSWNNSSYLKSFGTPITNATAGWYDSKAWTFAARPNDPDHPQQPPTPPEGPALSQGPALPQGQALPEEQHANQALQLFAAILGARTPPVAQPDQQVVKLHKAQSQIPSSIIVAEFEPSKRQGWMVCFVTTRQVLQPIAIAWLRISFLFFIGHYVVEFWSLWQDFRSVQAQSHFRLNMNPCCLLENQSGCPEFRECEIWRANIVM